MPMTKDFVNYMAGRIGDITSDIVRTRTTITLGKYLIIADICHVECTNLNETNSSLISQGTLHKNITVMVDPSLR